jgi:AhpD family alkylhydroperoxidase
LVSGRPVPDAAKITFYRPDFYGTYMKQFTQEAMRGRSTWSVGDLELMAAYVSKVNECPFCVGAHTATAARAYQDSERVAAELADLAFNTTDRLANAFAFDVLSQEGFEAGAKYLLKRGYR